MALVNIGVDVLPRSLQTGLPIPQRRGSNDADRLLQKRLVAIVT